MVRFIEHFKNLRFKRKVFISYLIVTVIPIITLGLYSYIQSQGFLFQQASQILSDSARTTANNINYTFKRCEDTINFICFDTRMQQIFSNNYFDYSILYEDLSTQLDPLFNNILNLNKEIKQVTAYVENQIPEHGNFILSCDRVKDKYWYKEAMKSNKVGWYHEDGDIFAVQKINDLYKNKGQGVLYVKLNHLNVFNSITSGQSLGAIVCDSDGNVIVEKNKIKNNSFSLKNELYKITNAENEKITISGKEYLIIKHSLPLSNWSLFYYTPVESITIDAYPIISATIIVVACCMVAVVFMIWGFSVTFVKRIENLNSKVKLVTDGDLNVQISSGSRDEIGELTNGVGNMLISINKLVNEVYHTKITQKEAELKALQAQINPHFLYNTLSLINWKAIRAKTYDISHITTTVSRFYRTILNKGKNVISIRDELENTKAYIEIQMIMHNGSFDVEYDIDESVYEYYMINIILQPVVENAIEHGIDHRPDERRGKLKVCGYMNEQCIIFTVEDNGAGMSQEVIDQILVNRTIGYGLKNIDERIKIFFGSEYGLDIKSKLGEGSKVIIKLPKFEAERQQ